MDSLLKSNSATQMKVRCQFCGLPELSPGVFTCGTVPGSPQSDKCYRLTYDITGNPGPNPERHCWRQGRKQCPERIELQAMEIGQSKLYPPESLKRVERARNVIAELDSDRKVVIRLEGSMYRAGVVPQVRDMAVGESRPYSDNFGLAYGFVRVANSAFLDGRKEAAYTFELIDGMFHIKRIT